MLFQYGCDIQYLTPQQEATHQLAATHANKRGKEQGKGAYSGALVDCVTM